jgi:3-hydroxybutyryl-CoA dehydrogenase
MHIQKIAIIGSGTMGGGIVHAAAQSGFSVLLVAINEQHARACYEKIEKRLSKRVVDGKLEQKEKDNILSRIDTSVNIDDCREVDLVIEAVAEQEEVKTKIFQTLDAICNKDTILTTNTSSISITRLAKVVKRADRFAGMHFMNPAYIMKLVEVIKGAKTSQQTVQLITAVAEKMAKVPVTVNDSPGFVANRILMPMINEAISCLQEAIASKESIDTIMKLGAHHPMGSLELADLIGLDTCLAILEVLHGELGEKYKPCELLRTMVADGKLGKKCGEGFYKYK